MKFVEGLFELHDLLGGVVRGALHVVADGEVRAIPREIRRDAEAGEGRAAGGDRGGLRRLELLCVVQTVVVRLEVLQHGAVLDQNLADNPEHSGRQLAAT